MTTRARAQQHDRASNVIVSRVDSGLIDSKAPDAVIKVSIKPADEFSSALLFGTVDDLLDVLRSLLRDDAKLLRSKSIDLKFTPALSEAQQAPQNAVLPTPWLELS
jgi:hypothetical protein